LVLKERLVPQEHKVHKVLKELQVRKVIEVHKEPQVPKVLRVPLELRGL
jgi:hypothetical protein